VKKFPGRDAAPAPFPEKRQPADAADQAALFLSPVAFRVQSTKPPPISNFSLRRG
jgi:hypothetical protein